MNEDLVGQFVWALVYGASKEVEIQDRVVVFKKATLSAQLKLPNTSASLTRMDELTLKMVNNLFDKNTKTFKRCIMSKTWGSFQSWL